MNTRLLLTSSHSFWGCRNAGGTPTLPSIILFAHSEYCPAVLALKQISLLARPGSDTPINLPAPTSTLPALGQLWELSCWAAGAAWIDGPRCKGKLIRTHLLIPLLPLLLIHLSDTSLPIPILVYLSNAAPLVVAESISEGRDTAQVSYSPSQPSYTYEVICRWMGRAVMDSLPIIHLISGV